MKCYIFVDNKKNAFKIKPIWKQLSRPYNFKKMY